MVVFDGFMTDCFENSTFLIRLCMMCFVLSEKGGTFFIQNNNWFHNRDRVRLMRGKN